MKLGRAWSGVILGVYILLITSAVLFAVHTGLFWALPVCIPAIWIWSFNAINQEWFV